MMEWVIVLLQIGGALGFLRVLVVALGIRKQIQGQFSRSVQQELRGARMKEVSQTPAFQIPFCHHFLFTFLVSSIYLIQQKELFNHVIITWRALGSKLDLFDPLHCSINHHIPVGFFPGGMWFL